MDETISGIIRDAVSDANRYPFLFVGSGLSRRYMNSPNWADLLEAVCSKALGGTADFTKFRTKASVAYRNEKVKAELPYVATLMEDSVNDALLDDADFMRAHAETIALGGSPMKQLVADIINSYTLEDDAEVELLKSAGDSKLSGIITTNYDQMCEHLFDSFTVYESQDDLLFAEQSFTREIYKIHGSVSNPDGMVLTDADYDEFGRKRKYLSAKLLSVFLEYPVIFLGYSIQDENIKSILSDIAECLSDETISRLKKRLIFVQWGNTTSIGDYTVSFGNKLISMTKIETDDFASIYESIGQTERLYSTKILQELRGSVFRLADKINPDSPVIVSGIDNALNSLTEDQRVIIGFAPSPASIGRPITPEDLFQDVILDDLHFDNLFIVENYLNRFVRQRPNSMPVFKYVQGLGRNVGKSVANYLPSLSSIDAFRNNTMRKSLNRTRAKHKGYLTVQGLVDNLGSSEAIKLIPYLNEDELDVDELEQLLRNELKTVEDNADEKKRLLKDTDFRKCIRIYDFLRYRNKEASDLLQ